MQFSKTQLAILFERASRTLDFPHFSVPKSLSKAPPRSSGTLPESMRLPWSCRLCRLCRAEGLICVSLSWRLQTETIYSRSYLHLGNLKMKSMKRYATILQAQNKTLLHLLHSLHLLHCCILRIALAFQVFFPSSSQPVFLPVYKKFTKFSCISMDRSPVQVNTKLAGRKPAIELHD